MKLSIYSSPIVTKITRKLEASLLCECAYSHLYMLTTGTIHDCSNVDILPQRIDGDSSPTTLSPKLHLRRSPGLSLSLSELISHRHRSVLPHRMPCHNGEEAKYPIPFGLTNVSTASHDLYVIQGSVNVSSLHGLYFIDIPAHS